VCQVLECSSLFASFSGSQTKTFNNYSLILLSKLCNSTVPVFRVMPLLLFRWCMIVLHRILVHKSVKIIAKLSNSPSNLLKQWNWFNSIKFKCTFFKLLSCFVPSVKFCITRWTSLRDRFVKEKKKEERARKNNYSKEALSQWEFYEVMSFIKDYVKHRKYVCCFWNFGHAKNELLWRKCLAALLLEVRTSIRRLF